MEVIHPPKLLLISELCNNPINWNGSTDTTWLSISPTNGTTPASVGVLVNISGLNAGTYSGTITINSAQAINSPQIVQVTLDICSDDALEEDDTYLNAKEIQVNGGNAQHLLVDPDYHYFNASQGIQYTIETLNLSHGTDTALSLFDTDGVTRLAFDDDSGEGFASKIVWTAPANGTYYIMIDAAYQNYKCNSSYDVKIASP